MNDFLPLFADETRAQLEALDTALHQLEDVPGSAGAVRAAFQAAHSIKGGAAMLELRGPQLVTGALEDLLSHLRAGGSAPDGWLPAAFAARDRLLWHLGALRPAHPPEPEDTRVAQILRDLLPSTAPAAARPATSAPTVTQDVAASLTPGAPLSTDTPSSRVTQSRPVTLDTRPEPLASGTAALPVSDVERVQVPSDRPARLDSSPPVGAVFDVSELSRTVLGDHLRRLGYQVVTGAQVTPPGTATYAVVSATLIDAALQAGWPPGALWVVSEQSAALAAARARGLSGSRRPNAQTPLHALPPHWILA